MTDQSQTPLMEQYFRIKSQYPNALLFYRMGDFYEMFHDDAKAAAEALDISLATRGKHMGEDIPICGVPVHSSEKYLLALIKKGFHVAVCEQLEDPAAARKRGNKAVVKRGVIRLVTPGTLTEDALLDARKHNFLVAYASVRGDGALAWVDISTGVLRVMECDSEGLSRQLARLMPAEALFPARIAEEHRLVVEETGATLTALADSSFDSASAESRLLSLYGVKALDAFGAFGKADLSALGAIAEYLELTQISQMPLLQPPVKESQENTLQIDAATQRNLELAVSLSGSQSGTLLETVDMTLTAPGARLLQRVILNPSTDIRVIQGRHDSVQRLVDDSRLREDLRSVLRRVPDIDRALQRLSFQRGGPRDLGAVGAGLAAAGEISGLMPGDSPRVLTRVAARLAGHGEIVDLLARALEGSLPNHARDGGFVKPGYSPELDECRSLRDEGRSFIGDLQREYVELSGVPSLRIKYNGVLGYFVETTPVHAKTMQSEPLSGTFIHRQSTAHGIRFTTARLSELEEKILNASDRALSLEADIYGDLRERVAAGAQGILASSQALAELDVLCSFAAVASEEGWRRPVVDDSRDFAVEGGRHPVVERAMRRSGDSAFIANSCDLSDGGDGRLWILTGPNMAGKSTFLRQNALIALLAQVGSFVPAREARIGLVNRLFSRVGASDDLARGRSTFMVEMVETATILNQADDRSLVILDEIGRGTATYDGLSIAWATLEHLHERNRCRALFATHYQELTGLSSKLDSVCNATVAVREWEGDVVFLHQVEQGVADRSYGVQVAKLAGLPDSVVARAKEVLSRLEESARSGGRGARPILDELPLFVPSAPPAPAVEDDAIRDMLRETNPDELTPIQALEALYKLRSLLKG